MSYSVEVIRRAEQTTSTWSGGTTTQLAIYPAAADYKARDFRWRLSSAQVDLEESTFTNLPGIYRYIMIIEGEMTLIHEGHHTILLKPFEQDSFSGDLTTKSIGRARDFNLMLRQDCKGELEAILVGEFVSLDTAAIMQDKGFGNNTQVFFCAAGNVKMLINSEREYDLYEGDLIKMDFFEEEEGTKVNLEFISADNAVVIRAGISYL